MNLEHMRYFVEICKYNNITRASESLHITQPALTKAVHQLEDELKISLFTRKQNRIYLTQAGDLFLQRCRALLQDIDAVVDEVQDYGEMRRRTVRAGIPATIGTILLPELDVAIRRDLNLEMEITEDGSVACIKKVLSGELDIAFVLFEDDEYPELEVRVLSESSLDFCTGRVNPLSNLSVLDPRSLENEKIIVYNPGVMIRQLFERYNITPKYTLYSNQVLTITKYLEAGLASTFQFPEAFARYENIVTVPLIEPMKLKIVMIRNKRTGGFQAVSEIFRYVTENRDRFILKKNA